MDFTLQPSWKKWNQSFGSQNILKMQYNHITFIILPQSDLQYSIFKGSCIVVGKLCWDRNRWEGSWGWGEAEEQSTEEAAEKGEEEGEPAIEENEDE